MADDVRKELKLSQQLVMTPQLQMAIRMLGTKTRELGAMLDTISGLEPADAGDEDLLQRPNEEELEAQQEYGLSPWRFDVAITGTADVCIAGEPPVARANRHVLPHVRVGAHASEDQRREALWFARALRQRALTYERFTAAFLALRPTLATATSGADLEPVTARQLAEVVGMHEATITRVATGCRIENRNGELVLTNGKRGITIV